MPLLLLFFAFIAPVVLWPIEIFFPYPHIAEELTKGLLIYFLLKLPKTSQKIYGAILIGFLFGLSENFLYLFSPGSLYSHLLRFVLTMPLHIISTLAILALGLIDKRLIFVGIILAILIHYLYNLYVPLLASWV